MHEIEEDLARLEGYLDALRGEVARLRQKVRRLEQEPSGQEATVSGEGIDLYGEKSPGAGGVDSSRNLADLYAQGYHVCNVHFGEPRWEQDCLFCIALLQRGEAEV